MSHPKGIGPSGRQGWLEGRPGKARSCRQEGWPPNVPPALSRIKRATWEKEAGSGGSSWSWFPPPRPKDLVPFSMEPNPDPSASKGLCLSLDIIAFLPQVRWQQIDYPDDSIEGIWGAGWGRFHPDVASDGLPPNPGGPMAPHFTLLEAVVIQLLSILPTAHPWAGPQHSSGNRGRLEERAARTAKAGQELK